MSDNIADRFTELRELAMRAGLIEELGDIPRITMAVMALGDILGLDQILVLDTDIELAEIILIAGDAAKVSIEDLETKGDQET